MKNTEVSYAGRQISASSATGYGKTHREELNEFLHEAMLWMVRMWEKKKVCLKQYLNS